MKRWTHRKLLAALQVTLLVALAIPTLAAESPLDRGAWLGGCWHSDGAEAGSGEQWMPLAGGTLLGINRSIRHGVTVAHEFMQIRQQADGAVVFIAQAAGRPEGRFTLLPGVPQAAVFENLQRDFPQRVVYRLEESGRLRARIEGQRSGVPAAVDFAFTRRPCDAPLPLPAAAQP